MLRKEGEYMSEDYVADGVKVKCTMGTTIGTLNTIGHGVMW